MRRSILLTLPWLGWKRSEELKVRRPEEEMHKCTGRVVALSRQHTSRGMRIKTEAKVLKLGTHTTELIIHCILHSVSPCAACLCLSCIEESFYQRARSTAATAVHCNNRMPSPRCPPLIPVQFASLPRLLVSSKIARTDWLSSLQNFLNGAV